MWVFWVLRHRLDDVERAVEAGEFQSRCGFSGFCDNPKANLPTHRVTRFNPDVGFLGSVTWGFGICLGLSRFNPDVGFLGSVTGGENPPTDSIKFSPAVARHPCFVDRGCTRALKRSTKWFRFNRPGGSEESPSSGPRVAPTDGLPDGLLPAEEGDVVAVLEGEVLLGDLGVAVPADQRDEDAVREFGV